MMNWLKTLVSLLKNRFCGKINKIKGETLSITGLATTAALNAVNNEIPNVSDLIKKAGCDTKTLNIDSKYFTTSDYNKFTNNILDAKIKNKKLVNKSVISGFIDNSDLDNKERQQIKQSKIK